MAQYKTIPLEFVEHTELAWKSYWDYERSSKAPNDAEVESDWIDKRKLLLTALVELTPRQREVFILKIGYMLTEAEIALKLNIRQQVVSRHFQKAEAKLVKLTVKITDT